MLPSAPLPSTDYKINMVPTIVSQIIEAQRARICRFYISSQEYYFILVTALLWVLGILFNETGWYEHCLRRASESFQPKFAAMALHLLKSMRRHLLYAGNGFHPRSSETRRKGVF